MITVTFQWLTTMTLLVVQHDFPQQSVCSKREEAKFSQQDLLEHQTSVTPHQLQEDGQSPRQLDECGQSPKQLKRKGSPEQQKEGLSPQLDMDSSPQYKGSSPQQQQQEGVSSRNQLHEDERSVWQLEDGRSPQQLREARVPARAAWPIATFVNDRVIINLVAARSAKKKAKELKRDKHRSSIWWLPSTDDSSERGHGEVLKQKAGDFSIVWPPMMIIMNSRLDKEENKKRVGIGNEELLDHFNLENKKRVGIGNEEPHDHFDSYHPVKARNSYDPVGNLDMSVLVFESSVAGHLDAERLHNQKQVGLLEDDEQFDLLELQEYGTDYYDDGLRNLFGEEVDEIEKLKLHLEMLAESDNAQRKSKETTEAELDSLREKLEETFTLLEITKNELVSCKESEAQARETVKEVLPQLEAAKETIDALRLDAIKTTEAYNCIVSDLDHSRAHGSSLKRLVKKFEAKLTKKSLDEAANAANEHISVDSVVEIQNILNNKHLETELNDAKCEVARLKSALEAAEIKCHEDSASSTAQVTSAQELVQQIKQKSSLREAELEEELKKEKADFMKMPFPDNTFDAVYAIEATCHAPDAVGCYSEVYRVLKPGQYFDAYEWCMTDAYDPNNQEQQQIKAEIELGNGLPDVRSTGECMDAIEDCRAAGALGGFNAHASNIVYAIFIAALDMDDEFDRVGIG
ncbi:hypothetical protein Droror1_Dr00005564 [Drosera rotundifolia]